MTDRVVFILCPPRSFSSVVGAMVGQHPDLYGLPEVNLPAADTVADLMRTYSVAGPQARHGLLRALAQLHDRRQTEQTVRSAQAWLSSRVHWSTKQVFDHLLEYIEPQVAVEKSPRTVMKREYLQRIRAWYPEARFLHLTRHPRSTGLSQINVAKRVKEMGMSNRRDTDNMNPDFFWLRAQQNILELLSGLPQRQWLRVKGEDLLSSPDQHLRRIAEWLNIRTDTEAIECMKQPELSPYSCLGPSNARYGADINFLESPRLRPGRIEEPVLDGPLPWAPHRGFPRQVISVAREYGYR
jgi:sulfotransferase family protein